MTDLPDGTGIFILSAEIGIDLVSDPVTLHENGDKRSCQQENPAAAFPNSGKGGVLHGDVHEIDGAVTGVRQQRQDDEQKQGRERQCRAKMGPSYYKPDNNDDREGKIIDDAAGFPKAEGIGEEGAGGDEWRLGKGG